jgi:hypothetical protein
MCRPTSSTTACCPRSLTPPQAWLTAVGDVGEPFRTGLDPNHAQAFFAQRKLTLRHDESTTEAALRLGVPGAQSIPDFYRLATLQVDACLI